MIILIVFTGIILITTGLIFFIKKNRKLSIAVTLLGLICFMLSGIMILAILHFGEAPRDDTEIQTIRW
jgi:uncharacterized membrane protein YhfC